MVFKMDMDEQDLKDNEQINNNSLNLLNNFNFKTNLMFIGNSLSEKYNKNIHLKEFEDIANKMNALSNSFNIFNKNLYEINNFKFLNNTAQNILSSLTENIQNNFKLLNNASLETLKDLTENIPSISKIGISILQEMNNNTLNILQSTKKWSDYFNDFNYKINIDGTLSYNDKVYNKESLKEEFSKEIECIEKNDNSLYEKKEKFIKKYWLLIFIFHIIFIIIPNFPETYHFYDESLSYISNLFNNTMFCFVIKEKAAIRSEANSNSKIIKIVLYDEKLEIISDVPRWYQVKYIDENGMQYIGWISKISIEIED